MPMPVLTAAQLADLNHACPALANLQLGTILHAGGVLMNALEALTPVTAGMIPATNLDTTCWYRETLKFMAVGDLTANITARALGIAPGAGIIKRAGYILTVAGADGTDPLSSTVNVLINSTTVFTTPPVIAKAATGPCSSFVSGTGVTVGVLNVAAITLALNDIINFTYTLTRTTPETEQSGLLVWVEVAYKVGL